MDSTGHVLMYSIQDVFVFFGGHLLFFNCNLLLLFKFIAMNLGLNGSKCKMQRKHQQWTPMFLATSLKKKPQKTIYYSGKFH